MSTLGEEINAILTGIQKDLQAIDLTKETDPSKIKGMATEPIRKVDETVKREDFGEKELGDTIGMFKEASDRVGTYDGTQDQAEITSAMDKGNLAEAQKISKRKTAREEVKKSIQGKYDELTRKKAVIDKYVEKFDPNELVKKQSRKIKAYEDKIKENETKMNEIENFKGKVNGQLEVIKNNLNIIKELEELEKLAKDIEVRENTAAAARAQGIDADSIKNFETETNNRKAKLQANVTALTGKYKGITLDPNNLILSIGKAKGEANKEIDDAKNSIKAEAGKSDKEYIKTEIKARLDAASDPVAFMKVFEETQIELHGENLGLQAKKDKLVEGNATIKLGTKARTAGAATATVGEPTEAEIQARMSSDSSIQALIPQAATDEKTKKQAVYESLVGGKKSKFLHPIAALRAQFSKKTMENWENKTYKDEMRRKAIEAIKAERQEKDKEKGAAAEVESKRDRFRKGLFVYVMNEDLATIEENENRAAAEGYAHVQDDDEPQQ